VGYGFLITIDNQVIPITPDLFHWNNSEDLLEKHHI